MFSKLCVLRIHVSPKLMCAPNSCVPKLMCTPDSCMLQTYVRPELVCFELVHASILRQFEMNCSVSGILITKKINFKLNKNILTTKPLRQ